MINLKEKLKLYKIYNSIISVLLIIALLMLINSYTTINRIVTTKDSVSNETVTTMINTDFIYKEPFKINYFEQITYLKNEVVTLKNEIRTIKHHVNNKNNLPESSPEIAEVQKDNEDTIMVIYDIDEASGLEDDSYINILNIMNIGYELEPYYSDIAKSIYQYETVYKVNGLFIISVMIEMLNNDTVQCNNLFGMMSSDGFNYRKYETYQDSIEYFTKLMRNRYFSKGALVIQDVAKIYMPYKSEEWSNAIHNNMTYIREELENEY